MQPGGAAREARGCAIVLLFAAYENLLKSLTRGLLESGQQLRVGNRRLQPGFQAAAIASRLQSVVTGSQSKPRPMAVMEVVRTLSERRFHTVDPGWFPDDGSFMRQPQVVCFCTVFGLGDPGPLLQGAWNRLDAIVNERNDIAHGRRRPDEIGRSYTRKELLDLVDVWETRWIAFISEVETRSSTRDFYRAAR